MAAFPSTDPIDDAYTSPLSMGRVIVVYNSDVSWSLTLATRYCRRKRIPTANLFGYAFGTNLYHWVPANIAAVRTMTGALETLWTSVGAQAILMAPGCPDAVEVTGVWDSGTDSTGGTGSWSPAAKGYPDLGKLCAGAKRFNDWYDLGYPMVSWLFAGTDYAWYYYADATHRGAPFSEYASSPMPNYWIRATGTISSFDPTYYTTYDAGTASEGVTVMHNSVLLGMLGDSTNLMLPGGRIGYWYGRGFVYDVRPSSGSELTFQKHQRAMENGMRFAEAASPDNRYRWHTHFQFNRDTGQQSLPYLQNIMADNGYTTSYAYRVTPSAEQEAQAPAAGAAYTMAAWNAGAVRQEYNVLVGQGSNDEPWSELISRSLLPGGGAGSFMGPSYGWAYCLTANQTRGGAGLTNASHITSGFYLGMQAMLVLLLRGLSWAEASFFSHYCGQQSPPCGDPLARPFPL